jgi:hypothetical protein
VIVRRDVVPVANVVVATAGGASDVVAMVACGHPAMRMICSGLLYYVAVCYGGWEVEISWQMSSSFLRDSFSE